MNGQAVLRLQLAGQPLEGLAQVIVVQHRRTELVGQTARLLNRFFEDRVQLPDQLRRRRAALDTIVQQTQVELRPGQHLLQIVVEDLREALALAVLRLRQFQGKPLELSSPLLELQQRRLSLRNVLEVEYEKLHFAGIVQQWSDLPVPIRLSMRIVGVIERLGIGEVRLLRLNDLLEDPAVLLIRIEVEVVLADEGIARFSVGLGVRLVDPHEVEIAVHKGQRRDRVLEEALEHLRASAEFALGQHPPGHLVLEPVDRVPQLLRLYPDFLPQLFVQAVQLGFHLLALCDVVHDTDQAGDLPLLIGDGPAR